MSSHCAYISCTICTVPAPLALPLICIGIFSPFTHIVPTPIPLCSLPSSLFLVQGYNLAKFFHWAFPNLKGSEHPSTFIVPLYSLTGWSYKDPFQSQLSSPLPSGCSNLNGETSFWEWKLLIRSLFPSFWNCHMSPLLSPHNFLLPYDCWFSMGLSVLNYLILLINILGLNRLPHHMDLLSMDCCC